MAQNNNNNQPLNGMDPSQGTGLDSISDGPGFQADALLLFPDFLDPILTTASPQLALQRLKWSKVDTLWEGTDSMKLAGRRYLPKEPVETEEEYEARKRRSVLVNHYRNTIEDAGGRVFAKDVCLVAATITESDQGTITKPPQAEFQSFACDVDGQGNNLTQFTKNVFNQAVNHGVSYVLVDYPRLPLESFVSLEQQVDSGARPYWVSIIASQVLDCRSAMIGGKQRMTFFEYYEVINELAPNGMTPASFEQIRIFKHDKDTPDANGVTTNSSPMYAIYRRPLSNIGFGGMATGIVTSNGVSIDSNGQQLSGTITSQMNAGLPQARFELIERGYLTNADGQPLTGIPVTPVYTNRKGFGLGNPALEDLADLNISHWQNMSDYINITHLTSVPFLFAKGLKSDMDENGKKMPMILSPGRAMLTDNDQAEVGWVEHNGQTIQCIATLIDTLEKQMKECGLKLTQEVAPAGRTATEVAVNVAESNSRLKSFALATQDALNLCLYYTSQFIGIPDNTRAQVSTDFADLLGSASDAIALQAAFETGAIGKDTLIYEFKRRNILDPSVTVVPPATNEASAVTENVSLTTPLPPVVQPGVGTVAPDADK